MLKGCPLVGFVYLLVVAEPHCYSTLVGRASPGLALRSIFSDSSRKRRSKVLSVQHLPWHSLLGVFCIVPTPLLCVMCKPRNQRMTHPTMYSSLVKEQGFQQFLHSGQCRVLSIMCCFATQQFRTNKSNTRVI